MDKSNIIEKLTDLLSKKKNGISLETVFKDRDTLIDQHLSEQNKITSFVDAAIVLLSNLFWLIFKEQAIGSFGLETVYGISGMALTSFVSLLVVYIIPNKKFNTRDKEYKILINVFSLGIIIGVLLFDIARCTKISAFNLQSPFIGISLSTLLLLTLVFIPTRRKKDSIVLFALIFIAAIVPEFICPSWTYMLREQLIFRISLLIGFITFRNVTVRNAIMIENLADASYLDYQTKTLNRKALSEYLEALSDKNYNSIGLLKFDIDDFKSFNSEYSHYKGDEVLKSISNTAYDVLKIENALIFRYGSGEFIATILNISEEKLTKCALKLRDEIQNLDIKREDSSWRRCITITVGCTYALKEELKDKDILSDVDAQLLIGKRGTKNCVIFKGRIFITEGEICSEQEPTLYTERVIQAVNEAMLNNEIIPYYQPLYDTMTQKLVGAEALARWVKKDGTVILPGEFVPELEKNSSILALDWYMYQNVCRMLKEQKEKGIKQVRISVNFSRMHALYERSIEKRLCEIADFYGVDHSLIEIEITESSYIRLPNIIEPYIKAIRSEGFAVAVDDFGSGASSLGFVKSVDIDTLKLDKSLISSNCENEKERVLLESVVYLAHRLELVSVAEGVETAEQLGYLKSLRCSHIQGFIFARPMPKKAFFELCASSSDDSIEEQVRIAEDVKDTPIQLLIDSVFSKYPMAILVDITKNTYYAKTQGKFINHLYKQSGKVTDLIEDFSHLMHPDYIDSFRKCFSLENQMKSFKNGESKISFITKLHGDNDKTYKDVEISSFFVKEQDLDNIFTITLCSEI